MYKLTLIARYLTRKLAPLSAALAVTLCTGMVIVVISVMGGFLDLLRVSAKSITGDLVLVGYGLQGFRYYDEMVAELEAMPEVEVALPVIESFGLINFGNDAIPVQVRGVDFAKLDQTIGLRDSLVWPPEVVTARLDDLGYNSIDELRDASRIIADPFDAQFTGNEPPDALVPTVIGIEVNPYQTRDEQGRYSPRRAWTGNTVTVTLVPLSESGVLGSYEPNRRRFVVANELKSGLFEVDKSTVLVPFAVAQRMLEMHPRQETRGFDPLTGEGGASVSVPGRANQIVVRLTPGVTDLEAARAKVRDALVAFQQKRPDASLPVVLTWEEMHGALLSAVANEKGLVTFLFVIISVVAVVMVATTFFVIVQQKTRDIGVLRAIGASRAGLLVMFLGYGLAIGLIGGVLGLIGAVLLVNNLNDVQHFLATRLGVTALLIAPAVAGGVLGAMVATVIGFRQQALLWWLGRLIPAGVLLGLVPAVASLFLFEDWPAWLNANIKFVMWDPQTYFFDEIPGRVDPWEAGPIVLGAIFSSVLGAVVPALVASAKKPVDALRYE